MAWLDKIIEPGEEMIFRSKAHESIVWVPFGLMVILFLIGSYGILFWLSVIFSLLGVFNYFYYEYAVTNRRIITKYGFFYIRYRELSLQKVDNVICWQNIADRRLGTGLITLFGVGITQHKFRRMANAMDFKHAVYSQLSTEQENYFEK
ncbi:PH domain-containing protein [Rhodohalobacter sp. SW132]|uniref:PH domain-containing protein n=1 Tax=Rhodohalobacter sp. SW132 TaxID=2293433 RepID=UPI000E287A42|nr:PH domain-containing protein [Rhodohalobacter sp. SW132]REL24841.1 PH domain-containing protein [Rhodohalobacter sp. SW132]